MNDSPIERVSKELGLSLSNLAIAANVSITAIYTAKSGANNISKKTLAFLIDQGYDAEQLQEEQEDWINQCRQKTLSGISKREMVTA